MSKEHIWPVWMHKYLSLQGDGKYKTGADTFKWKEQIDSNNQTRPGHLTTMKLRVVCRSCNSGWMGALETQVKPTLVKILKNESISLNAIDQTLLARWIVMKVIIGEYAEKGIHLTPKDDRLKLKQEGSIPDYFAIYIGKHNSESDSAWLRISQTIALSPKGPNPPLGDLKRNMQSVSFICGSFFAFALAIREKGINPAEFLGIKKVSQIFPELENVIRWPPQETLTERNLGQIAYAIDELKYKSNVIYAGDLP